MDHILVLYTVQIQFCLKQSCIHTHSGITKKWLFLGNDDVKFFMYFYVFYELIANGPALLLQLKA